MTPFDTVVAVILTLSLVYSIIKGMIREIFSLVAYVGGYLMAVKFKGGVADILLKTVGNKTAADILGFVLVFFACSIVIGLVGRAVRNVVHSATALSWVDRLTGGVIGVAKGVIILTVLMFPLKYFPDVNRDLTRDSFFAPHLKTASNFVSRSMGGTNLFDHFPDLSLDGVKDNIEDRIDDMKELGGKLKELEKVIPLPNNKPQDNYTEEDKKKLDNILKTLDKD